MEENVETKMNQSPKIEGDSKQQVSKVDQPVKLSVEEQIKAAQEKGKIKGGVIEELKLFQTQVKTFKPQDLYIPILSLFVMTLLTIFVYIPMIRNAVDSRNEKREISEKIGKLNKLNDELDAVDVGNLQMDLASVRTVIPFSLQVSDFLLYVDNLAKEKNLDFKEVLAGDVLIRSKGETRDIDPTIKGVSGPLKYVGDLDDITEFLGELQNISPFIVSSDDVELRKSADGEKWEVAIVITGYYLNRNAIPKVNIYSSYTPYTQYEDILNILKDKAESLSD